jgi:hypothetical protein
VCDAIDEESLRSSDDIHAHADARVDIYTKARFQWGADMCLTDLYSEAESRAEDCDSLRGSINDQLGAIQYFAIEYIAETILAAWEAHKREESDETEESEERAAT